MKAFFVLVFLLLSFQLHAGTKMVGLADDYGIKTCRAQLVAIAEDVIGDLPHRLHLDKPKRNLDKYPFAVVGVVTYNDREAQLQFTASPMDDGGCEVTSLESFFLPEACVEVREQVFKKWKFVGRLSDDSFFLRHKDELTRNATLSAQESGASCLVSRRHSGI